MTRRDSLESTGERIMVIPTAIVDRVVWTGDRLGREIIRGFWRGLDFLLR